MQLREMPRGGEMGNIVDVPTEVNSTIQLLPRMLEDSKTIMLKLARSITYTHHIYCENVRPTKGFEK